MELTLERPNVQKPPPPHKMWKDSAVGLLRSVPVVQGQGCWEWGRELEGRRVRRCRWGKTFDDWLGIGNCTVGKIQISGLLDLVWWIRRQRDRQFNHAD